MTHKYAIVPNVAKYKDIHEWRCFRLSLSDYSNALDKGKRASYHSEHRKQPSNRLRQQKTDKRRLCLLRNDRQMMTGSAPWSIDLSPICVAQASQLINSFQQLLNFPKKFLTSKDIISDLTNPWLVINQHRIRWGCIVMTCGAGLTNYDAPTCAISTMSDSSHPIME